jgi:hypothetical protein
MSYWRRAGRYRGNKKRLAQIRFTREDKWFFALLALLTVLSVAAGAWLAYIYSE